MRYCFFIIFFVVLSQAAKTQTWGDSTFLETAFYSVEENPKYENGINGLYEFVSKNLKLPVGQKISLINSIVVVNLVISKSGKVVYAKFEKGVAEEYNSTILRLISEMPSWIPAKQNGRHVSCVLKLPILIL